MTRAPRSRRKSRIAMASATPSSGSVPVPISSIRTRPGASNAPAISEMFLILAENVLRPSGIDWWSPISMKMPRNTGSTASVAGTGSPDWNMSDRRPGLQGDRLAAGVRTADHQDACPRRQLHVEGHDRAPLGFQGLLQERVAGGAQPQLAARGDLAGAGPE